ncbi:MAG: type II secretion system protein GspE, partial [Clostridiaceae bacterium]|nr:type II secretion system protein GspE [Clostridiaceae bacterium]
TSVVGIVAQRLVKRLCTYCRKPHKTSRSEMALLDIKEPAIIYQAKGCNECGQTGYRGRTAIHEVLVMNRQIRDLIARDTSVDEVKDAAIADGMHTLHQSCAELVLAGTTTLDQLIRVTHTVNETS